MALEISPEVQRLAETICRAVKAKQKTVPRTHNCPQIAVVVDQLRKYVWIGAGNFPKGLEKHGTVLARTLHQSGWSAKYGQEDAYASCVEIAPYDLDTNPKLSDWNTAVSRLEALGFDVYLTSKFR
jgi:hypothetical protein